MSACILPSSSDATSVAAAAATHPPCAEWARPPQCVGVESTLGLGA